MKILKKHDKRTGAVLRLPFIRRVLLQPFFSTELLSQLVQECEKLLSTFPPPPIQESIDVELAAGAGEAQSEPQDLSYPTGNFGLLVVIVFLDGFGIDLESYCSLYLLRFFGFVSGSLYAAP